MNAPIFDGNMNPNKFLDWLDNMQNHFGQYNLTSIEIDDLLLKNYWQYIQSIRDQDAQEPIIHWYEITINDKMSH